MKLIFAVLASALVATVIATPSVPALTFSRKADAVSVPSGWNDEGPAPSDALVDVTIAVRQTNLEKLESELMAVSDPKSKRYGQHLSKEQVDALTAPKAASLVRIEAWLKRFGLVGTPSTSNSDFVSVETTVELASKLLNTEFRKFSDGSRTILRTPSGYHVPSAVVDDVDFVTPTTRFPAELRVQVHDLQNPSAANTPESLRALYSVPSNVNGSVAGNRQAFASFLGQFFKVSDAQTFFQQYAKWESGMAPTILGPNEGGGGLEATLDVEYVMSMGANVPTDAWSTAGEQPGNPENEPFIKWITNLSAQSDSRIAKAISVSYGDNEDSVEYDYAVRVNAEFQKLGARGISIMFSSGDGGVAGSQPSECPNGKFIPTFPAASPYVTAVGGTAGQPEQAAGLSAGGFSNRWARPSYQDEAVKTYLSTASNLPDPSHYNATGAGFPDVSAQGVDFTIVFNGGSTGVSGTSCSSPTFTGIIALLNAMRLKAGKSTLGYLNPLVYQTMSNFNDITSGSNPGCNTEGFPAAKGWDPVTGVGTMNYAKWSQAIMDLP